MNPNAPQAFLCQNQMLKGEANAIKSIGGNNIGGGGQKKSVEWGAFIKSVAKNKFFMKIPPFCFFC